MKKNNILFYFNWQLVTPFWGIIIDKILELKKDTNNRISLLTCDAKLLNCYTNNLSNRIKCKECIFTNKIGLKSLGNDIIHITIGQLINEKRIQEFIRKLSFNYNSIKEIKNLIYKNVFIGYGALSSYVSYTRNQEPIFNKEFRKYFNELLISQVILTEALLNLFNKEQFNELYVYNGRWADVRPVFDLGINKNIRVNVLESVNEAPKWYDSEVYINVLPQDINYRTKMINDIWEKSNDDLKIKEKIAHEFYFRRKNSELVRNDIKIFTKNQKLGLLPGKWDKSKINIVIFNSSEDEFVSLGREYDSYALFENNEMGIINIIKNINDTNVHFYLRIHPNLKKVSYGYHKRLLHLEENFKNITVISANSQISTYSMLENADKIIVFCSIVGAEANYWGKPVILLSGSAYYYLDVAYIPKTEKELLDLIKTSLKPKEKLGAIKYAYYLMKHEYYTKRIEYNPVAIKYFTKTIGYKFPHLKIFGSSLLYKIFITLIYRNYLKILNLFKHNEKQIPRQGY